MIRLLSFLYSNELIRLRIEQELRNLVLRLRRRYLTFHDDPPALAVSMAGVTTTLAVQLSALLKLKDKDKLVGNDPMEIWQAASSAFNLDLDALKMLTKLRNAHDSEHSIDLTDLYGRLMDTVTRTIQIANDLSVASTR